MPKPNTSWVGNSPSWSPHSVAGLPGGWDATDASTITDAGSGAVSQWDDMSGNDHHAQKRGGNWRR
jgi:hypothetical protein